jgi:hypothetical protein
VTRNRTPPFSASYWYRRGFTPPISLSTSTPQRLHPEDGDSMVLRNDGILPQHYGALQIQKTTCIFHRRENLKSRRVLKIKQDIKHGLVALCSISAIMLPSTSRSSEWPLPFRFPDQNFVTIFRCLGRPIPRPSVTFRNRLVYLR